MAACRSIPAFRRRVDRVDELIHAEIRQRPGAEDIEERDDILSLLVAARHEDGSAMSEAEIRDELLTLLVAGQIAMTLVLLIGAGAGPPIRDRAGHPGRVRRRRAPMAVRVRASVPARR